MNDSVTSTPTVEYKVVLAVPASKMILAMPEGNAVRLPRVHIHKWTRPAEEITRELRENWNLNTVVLSLVPNVDSQPGCAVAEVMDAQITEGHPALRLSCIEELDRTDLDAGEQDHVNGVLTGSHKSAGPFSRPGWIKEAQDWIQRSLANHRIEFNEELRQYNAGDTLALIRFGTHNGQSYWLKAIGERDKHEFAVTLELSRLFPQYLPPLVAVRKDWNAWVTENAGKQLGSSDDVRLLVQAVMTLADFQIRSLDHISCLETAGCVNRRLSILRLHLPDMVTYLETAMAKQTSTKVKPLTPARLQQIGSVVDRACSVMQSLGIPDTLVNGDINLDNILYDGSSFRFTDWAEGGIGNPFLTLQQVIQHVIRDGECQEWVPELREAYGTKWLPLLNEQKIDRAFVLMPLLTMADYLRGRGDWLSSSSKNESTFQSFARTLARCMDRAVAEPALVEALSL
jgi:hypothetical protein